MVIFFKFPDFNNSLDKASLSVGVHIERGLDPKLKGQGLWSEKLIMDEKWEWEHFLNGLQSSVVLRKIDQMARRTDLNMEILLGYGAMPPNTPVSDNPDRNWRDDIDIPWDGYNFQWNENNRELQLIGSKVSGGYPKLQIPDRDGPTGFVDKFMSMIEDDKFDSMMYLDFYIFANFVIKGSVSNNDKVKVYQPREIWNELLKPLNRWVRELG